MKIQHPFPLYFSLFLLFLATTTILISPSHGALGKCNPSDYNALMNTKKSLKNPYELTSWNPNTDCCEWYEVKCDPKTNRITEFSLVGSSSVGGLSGQIPSSIGSLSYLESVGFWNYKHIIGSIPLSIKVKASQLPRSQLSESLSGSIPPNLSELKNLEAIHLDRNRLMGPIPESFGSFPGPTTPSHLYLSHNQLSGQIPKSLDALDSSIDLSWNRFVGNASMLFNPNHGSTYYMDLSRNQFEFDLTKAKFPMSLIWLDLSHNKIFGRIPEEIKGLGLETFNVSYNNLYGKIPYGGKMQSFHNTAYFLNKCLCGPPLMGCKKLNA
ncbi:hypothetical protein C5167_035081 [Papaver somniferum]|uniref:Leucine-rich repeat-containing N-terminal plant-type domain-containing protein n=1 Tax=Papaver somniferum TaxID=3469 RepID=A0A4Y7KGE5_PAPSO|nr:hypothetical protein C5167_035081 [Papaver somniferum]